MPRFHTFFFDLDGTLTDPALGITSSIQKGLEACGIEPPPREALLPFIGPPLAETFSAFGLGEEEVRRAVAGFRAFFSVTGIFENKLYPGIPEMLASLREAGATLCIATSKPEEFAVRIAEHFGIARYFHRIAGAAMDETRTKKAEVLAYLEKEIGLSSVEGVLMIGDRRHDVTGARARGIPAVGVLYGYGSEEELREAGVFSLAATVNDLSRLLHSFLK